MQYMLLIYEDESLYGNAGKVGPALQEIVAKHMAFNRDLGAIRDRRSPGACVHAGERANRRRARFPIPRPEP